MFETIQFLFSDFWRWLGGFIYLALICEALGGGIIRVINKKVKKKEEG